MNLRKIRLLLPVGALALILTAILLYSSPSTEPSYQGRRLGTWLTQIVDARSEREAEPAMNAVRQIGTNAIPGLLTLMRARDSKAKEFAMALLKKQHIFNVRIEDATGKHLRAALGFEALGTNASPATPELKGMLDDPGTVRLAGAALISIGAVGVDAVASGLESTNAIVRRECAGLLGALGVARFSTNANATLGRMEALEVGGPIAVPPLLIALNDSDELVRAKAAIALGLLGQQPRIVVPALIKHLHDTYGWRVPSASAKALGRFGADAANAIPELKRVADHPDSRVREAVEGAIRAIETQSEARPP